MAIIEREQVIYIIIETVVNGYFEGVPVYEEGYFTDREAAQRRAAEMTQPNRAYDVEEVEPAKEK